MGHIEREAVIDQLPTTLQWLPSFAVGLFTDAARHQELVRSEAQQAVLRTRASNDSVELQAAQDRANALTIQKPDAPVARATKKSQ
jgi:hypothetical protein